MDLIPELKACSIVLVGELNPKIFQPAWFAIESIIGKKEADNADIKIIHPDIVVFGLGWLELQVTRDRFMVVTSQEAYYESLRDFVVSTFMKLQHTPIHMLGINWDYHYPLKNAEELGKIFNTLSPKSHWDKIFDAPNFISLTIQDTSRSSGLKGYYNLKIEPSSKTINGLFLNCNDHYELSDIRALHGSMEILEILNSQWKYSYEKSNTIIEKITGES